ncbi:MAG: two-component regulator propeller domain-containing protein [Bacteroidia bacterium]
MNKLLPLFTLLFFLHPATHAQWVTYRSDNTAGLSSDLVSSIHEGIDGFLWFGTDNGVVKYDRNNNTWDRFTIANGLGDNFIYDVKSFNSNTIWVASNGGGVSRYISGSWTTLTTDDGLASNTVRAITRSNSGKIWFATYGGGLSRLYNSQWTTYNTTNGMPTNYFYSAFTDADGNLWFGTSNHGVMKFDSVWTNYTDLDGLAGNTVLSIGQTDDGKMLFAGTNGVTIYDGNTWQTITQADGLPANLAYSVMEDADGNIRIGTDNGMSIYDGNNLTTVTTANGIASDKVYSIMQDSQSDIWLGHLDNGASRYTGTQWLNYYNGTGLTSNYVYESAQDMNGTMWFRTSNGITKYDGINWTSVTTFPGLPDYYTSSVADMAVGNDGKIWFALYYQTLICFNGSTWEVMSNTMGGQTSKILVDSQNNVWVANNTGMVARYNGTDWYYYSANYSGYYCYDMYEDSNGKIWFATNDGLFTYKNGLWDNFNDAQHAYFKNIKSITGDKNGNVWFTYFFSAYANGYYYYYDGIIKYDGHWWYNIYDDELHTVTPNTILCSSTNELWLGGNQYCDYNDTALSVFSPQGTQYYYNNSLEIANCQINHLYEDSQHNIWISTTNGITKGNLLTVGIDNPKPETQNSVAVFPNPFSNQTNIVFEMQDAGTALFEVYDVTGKLVFNNNYIYTTPGKTTITFDGSNFNNGIYFFKVNTTDKQYSGKMSLMN